jgi:hypothetical protein
VITVVSGLPRSGTSLMMQMLAAGGMALLTDNVRAADEDNPRGYFEYEAVKRTKRDASREMLLRSGRAGADVSDEKLRELFAAELAQTTDWLMVQPNFRMLDVEYRHCLGDTPAVAARVGAFLGGLLDEAAMAAAIDPALYRQRRLEADAQR